MVRGVDVVWEDEAGQGYLFLPRAGPFALAVGAATVGKTSTVRQCVRLSPTAVMRQCAGTLRMEPEGNVRRLP